MIDWFLQAAPVIFGVALGYCFGYMTGRLHGD